jgi:hypothetical protein
MEDSMHEELKHTKQEESLHDMGHGGETKD